MKVDRTNAERQARHRAKKRLDAIEARLARLETEVARLRGAKKRRRQRWTSARRRAQG